MSSSTVSTPIPEWTCTACKASDNVVIELQEVDGAMVCPRCAKVDAIATSVSSHVDLNEVTGQIIESNDTLRTLDKSRMMDGDKKERRFTRNVDAMIKTNLSQIFGQSNYNLENGARLWFNKIREVDQRDRGLSKLTTLVESRRLPYLVALSARMAVQESVLIPIYNRLKDKRRETAGAVRNYTKGDDRVITMTLNDIFVSTMPPSPECTVSVVDGQAKGHEILAGHDPARLTNLDTFQQIDRHMSRELGNALSSRDEVLCTVNRAIVIVQRLAQADPQTRKTLLKSDQTKKGWPADPLDRLKQKITSWDEVLCIANGLYQAQACVSLFPDPSRFKVPAVTAIVLVSSAIQMVLGEHLKNYAQVEAELVAQFACHRQTVTRRHNELDRLIMAWATSIPEAGLPLPKLKMPNKTTQMGDGLSGWGSDSRRSIPFSAIVPKAGRVIAENWQAIKRVRLKRPASLPFDDEAALTKKMFVGTDIAPELGELLRKHTISEPGPSRSISPDKSDMVSERSSRGRSESRLNEIGPEEMLYRLYPPSPAKSTRGRRLDEVREWIEKGDDSSDDEGSGSTDDEDSRPQAKRPRLFDTRQEIGELPRPFAFSIGPTGFGIDRSHAEAGPSPGDPSKSAGPSSIATIQRSISPAPSVESGPSDGLTAASDSCQMVRQPSETPSTASSSGSSTSMTPTTPFSSYGSSSFTSRLSPAPSSLSVRESTISRSAQLRAVQRGLADETNHVGVLIRERAALAAPDTRAPRPKLEARKPIELNAVMAIKLWLDSQLESGAIPKMVGPAHLESLGLPGGQLPSDLRDYLASQVKHRSTLETLLRIGVPLDAIPEHLFPQSTCAVNLDLYHYRQRDDILGISGTSSAELDETLLRLFFRGYGNETLSEAFLSEKERMERIQDYNQLGHWEILEDCSPVPRAKKRRARPIVIVEPDNMIQRIAHEYEHDVAVVAGDAEAETEMIQKAVVAGLIRVQQKPRWDAFKDTATVPRLWYNDDLSILRLVPQTKISFADASALSDSVWRQWKAQEQAGHIDMPPPAGEGAR